MLMATSGKPAARSFAVKASATASAGTRDAPLPIVVVDALDDAVSVGGGESAVVRRPVLRLAIGISAIQPIPPTAAQRSGPRPESQERASACGGAILRTAVPNVSSTGSEVRQP